MSFIAPLAILLSALVVPILLLYMLRLRRREVAVSSTLLWQQLLRDREANAPWQRIRRNLLLLLQLLILAALIFALMRPYIEVPTFTTGRNALLIDASASMNATDVAPTRFEAARQHALDIISTMGELDSLAVIRVADAPEMVESYTADRERLRAAVNAMQPGAAPADWNAALTLAAAGAQGAENFSIILISDGGIPDDVPLSGYGAVRFIQVGESGSNMAITALATGHDQVAGPQIYAQIANYGGQTTEIILTISLDGVLFRAAPYTVPAEGFADVVISGLPPDFRRVEARLVRPTGSPVPDHLPLDDTAWAVFNPASAGRAVVLSRGNRFLEQGLASLPDWRVFRGDPARGLPGDAYDLYVFDGWLPPTLPDANLLIVNPPADAPALRGMLTLGPETRLSTILRVRADDPRTRYLRFNDVNVLVFQQVSGANWADMLVEAEGGPLVLAGEYQGRRVAVIPFDLFDSDLPLKIEWPILLANLTEWYKAPRAVRIEGPLGPGQTVVIQPLSDSEEVRITRPDGVVRTLAADQPLLIYADTPLPGIYTVDLVHDGRVVRQEAFAVNLFDAVESRIAPRTPDFGTGAFATPAILALEWFAYHRRLQTPRVRPAADRRFARRG